MVVDEFTQTQVLGERGRQDQPGIVDQAVVIEGDVDVVGVVATMEWSRSGGGFVFPKPLSPKHRRTLLTPWHAATLIFSVDWGLLAEMRISEALIIGLFPLRIQSWGVTS